MEFNKKLQELRKQKGLTQEELAESLFVSRTAISKWESGRGYPNLDSLKAIASFFTVTIDELLSGEEVITIAEEDNKLKRKGFTDLVFGLLDVGAIILFFLPFFAQKRENIIEAVSLFNWNGIAFWLRVISLTVVILNTACGILMLSLQNCQNSIWQRFKNYLSLLLNIIAVLLFIVALQPYAAVLLLMFLAIKIIILIKK